MPKKLFAVTNVKAGSDGDSYFAAGSPIDRSKFTDEQLKELYENGAIEIRTVDEDPTKVEEEPESGASTESTDKTETTDTTQEEQEPPQD